MNIKKLIFSRGIIDDTPPQPDVPGTTGPRLAFNMMYAAGSEGESENFTCSTTRDWTATPNQYGMGSLHQLWLVDENVHTIPLNTIRLYDGQLSATPAPSRWYLFGFFPLGVPAGTPRFWVDSSGYVTKKVFC